MFCCCWVRMPTSSSRGSFQVLAALIQFPANTLEGSRPALQWEWYCLPTGWQLPVSNRRLWVAGVVAQLFLDLVSLGCESLPAQRNGSNISSVPLAKLSNGCSSSQGPSVLPAQNKHPKATQLSKQPQKVDYTTLPLPHFTLSNSRVPGKG